MVSIESAYSAVSTIIFSMLATIWVWSIFPLAQKISRSKDWEFFYLTGKIGVLCKAFHNSELIFLVTHHSHENSQEIHCFVRSLIRDNHEESMLLQLLVFIALSIICLI